MLDGSLLDSVFWSQYIGVFLAYKNSPTNTNVAEAGPKAVSAAIATSVSVTSIALAIVTTIATQVMIVIVGVAIA